MTAVTEGAATTDEDTGSRFYTHPLTGEDLWSVTTILGATQGKPWLQQWAAKLAAEYAVGHLDELARVKVCKSADDAVKIAKEQAKKARYLKADTGKHVHKVIEALIYWATAPDPHAAAVSLPGLPEHLAGADFDGEPIEDVIAFMVGGFVNFCADFRPEFDAAEMTVFNRDLGYAGTLDTILALLGYGIGASERFIARPGHRLPLCVDFKTGKYLDVTYPEQLSAYRRARECLLKLGQVIAMPATEASALLHLRPEYERGYRLMLVSRQRDAEAWNLFRRAVELFTGREGIRAKPGKVVYPLRADGTMPSPLLRDLDDEGYPRAPLALFKAGVRDLEQLAAMTAGDCLKCRGVGPKSLPIIRRMLADHGLSLRGEENLALIDQAGDADPKVA